MKRAALLFVFLAGCACAPLEDGKRLYSEGRYAEALVDLNEAVRDCHLPDDQIVQPLALMSLCDLELGRRAESEARLVEAAQILQRLPKGAAIEGDAVIVALAMGAFHEAEGKAAYDNIASNQRPEIFATLALDSYDAAIASYASIIAAATDPMQRRFGILRWARALLMKARIHEVRATKDDLKAARAAIEQALVSVKMAATDASALQADFVELDQKLAAELDLIREALKKP